jgi:adenine-specific DNA-methyltransferase
MGEENDIIEDPERFDLRSEDIVEGNREQLARIFPEALTEGGKVDFDRLKLALGEEVDVGKERYGLTWPGKAECFKTIQAPSIGTLRPCPGESVNWDSTENLIIEGDNLEVLKLLQKSYLGKVKMIYIDPPYNTGNDFIYPDNFTESLRTYLEYTGQVDSEGKKFSTNTDTDGRYHSKWLNMMYPRLYLARNLLREDGVIFASIDDGEVGNLQRLLDDVFGESNRLAILIWNKQHSQQQGVFKRYHEYVLVYARDGGKRGPIEGGEGEIEAGALKRVSRSNPASEFTFPAGVRFEAPDGTILTGEFGDSEKVTVVMGQLRAEGGHTVEEVTLSAGWTQKTQMTAYFSGEDVVDTRGQRVLEFFFNSAGKLKCRKERGRITPSSILREYGMVSEPTAYISRLFGKPVFDNPKPVDMLGDFVEWFADPGDLVLDFFAGSYTICDAVLRRAPEVRFMTIQLPEPVDLETEAGKNAHSLGLDFITDVGLARTKLVIEDLGQQLADEAVPMPGFRVFRLDESNFATWDSQAPEEPEELAEQLEMHVNHVREGRSDEDLLFELLLKSGFTLDTPIQELALGGEKVYSVHDGMLVVCLARTITQELIDQIADLVPTPGRVVCLDEGLAGNDQLKVNANETFRTKGVESFNTV